MSNVKLVLGDGDPDSHFGEWVAVYVDDTIIHEGVWPIPLNVMRDLLQADITQVSIDGGLFSQHGDGLPESFEDVSNTAGVSIMGTQSYQSVVDDRNKKMAEAKARIEANKNQA